MLAACMHALDQIDGDSLSGICFVGHSQFMYSSFIFAPVTLSFFVGLAFVAAGRKVPLLPFIAMSFAF